MPDYKRFVKAAEQADGKTHRMEFDFREVLNAPSAEPATIVSIRVEDALVLVEGSVLETCSGCKAPVGVSRESQTILAARPGTRVLCVQCATAELEHGGPLPPKEAGGR